MACPYLEYIGGFNPVSSNGNDYLCKACKMTMTSDSAKFKYACYDDYDERYKDCEVYKVIRLR